MAKRKLHERLRPGSGEQLWERSGVDISDGIGVHSGVTSPFLLKMGNGAVEGGRR